MLVEVGNHEAVFYASFGNLVQSFDATISLYLDGVPRPREPSDPADTLPHSSFFIAGRRKTDCQSTSLSCVSLRDEFDSPFFTPLCRFSNRTSISSRIGNHFSLGVGSFCFGDGPARGADSFSRLQHQSDCDRSVVIPSCRISSCEGSGSLPLSGFLELVDDEESRSELAHIALSLGNSETFVTQHRDPNELDFAALCRFDGKWEVCEILSFDPSSLTFRIRLKNIFDRFGNRTEKSVSRAAIALETAVRDTKAHEMKLWTAKLLRQEYEQRFRTDLLLDLWGKSGHHALDERLIQNVVCEATKGFDETFAPVVQNLVAEVKHVFSRALDYSRLEYLCLSPKFRELVAPLNINIPRITQVGCTSTLGQPTRSIQQMKSSLQSSLRWSRDSNVCVQHIIQLWEEKYAPLVLLDARYEAHETVPLPTFLRNARSSLEVSIAMLRMSLLSDIDVVMMTDLEGSEIGYSYVTVEEYSQSRLHGLFLFVQVFLQSKLFELARKSAELVVKLFSLPPTCQPAVFGVSSDSYFQVNGVRSPLKARLMIELKYIGSGRVKIIPEIERIEGELLDLVDDLVKDVNKFSKPDVVVMSSLQLPNGTIDVISSKNPHICEAKDAISSCIAFAAPIIKCLVDEYGKHAALVDRFVVDESDYFGKAGVTTDETNNRIESEVRSLRKALDQVMWTSADVVCCGVISVDCSHAKESLIAQWDSRIKQLLDMVERKVLATSTQSVRVFKKMKQRLTTRPTCVEELDELLVYSRDSRQALTLIRQCEVVEVISWVNMLETLRYPISEEAFSSAYQLVSWPAAIDETLRQSDELFVKERASMAEELEEYKNKVHSLVNELDVGVTALLSITEQDKCDVAVTSSKSLRVLVEEIDQRIVVALRREGMLGMEATDFGAFLPVKSTFEALEQYWTTISDSTEHIMRFYETPISDANAEKMIENSERWRRMLRSATRSLRGFSALLAIGRKHEHFIMTFEQATPLVEMLTQPGVRQIHWKDISKRLGLPAGRELLPSDPSVTLHKILSEGALDHVDEISAIVSQATTDFAAETKLEKMKSETRKQLLSFEILDMAAGQVNALSNSAEIAAMLDSFIVQTQHLHSRYNLLAALAQAAETWETMLLAMQETLSLWMSLQTDWLQLRPTILVPSESLSVVSPEIALRFRQVDDAIRQVIDELDRPNQNLYLVMTIETLPNRLQSISNQLRVIREGILLLMDAKRASFPRFFFLSDKELLSCLSALNIRAVISLLQRMYPKLHNLDLYKGDISGFVSSDGVRMRCEPYYPVTSEPIETWMQGLEVCLVKALRGGVEFCLNDFSKAQPRVWLLRHSGQLVDISLRLRYAIDLEEVLTAVGSAGLKAYLTKTLRLLEEYFRVSDAELGVAEHRTVSNSVAFLLHCREEVQAMIENGVQSAEQLDSFPMFRTVLKDGRLIVKLFHLTIPYGNEFLGHYSSPIITPTMFRSSRAIFLSQAACCKTMLTGSGGVGKKQTMCDIATYLGTFLWSVQCHETLTLQTLAPLLRALMGVGGWLCLDDMNLLEPQILSEVCRIVKAIDTAQKDKNSRRRTVDLPVGAGGEVITLFIEERFNVVATSSISYDEVPTVIADTFRPISLTSADFSVLAKALLCTLGFEDVYVTLGDAVGSLFQQFHDVLPGVFSVRSLILVLRLSRTFQAPSLAGRVAMSLRQLLGPAIEHEKEMCRLFEARVNEISSDFDTLTVSFAAGRDDVSLQTHALMDFEKIMQINSSVIVYGPHYSGKSRLISAWGKSRNVVTVAPKTISSEMYYGTSTGVLATLFRECSSAGEHLLWFEDADMRGDGIWAQCASNQRKVHLDPSNCVVMSSDTWIVASTTSLKDASPTIVSRFSLFSSGLEHPWQEQLRTCSSLLVTAEISQPQLAVAIIETLLPVLLNAVCSSMRLHDAATQVIQFLAKWYQYVISTSTQTSRLSSDRLTAVMVQCTVFTTAWSIGLALDPTDRPAFEDAFLESHEAVAAIVCQHDSTIEIFPPGEILSHVATAQGWKLLVVDESTESWCLEEPGSDSKTLRGWELVAKPAFPTSHYCIEMLLRSGQSVFLTGGEQSGKSHILRRCQSVGSWFVHSVACCKDTPVSLLQQTLTPRLFKRQHKVYGPAVGKQLIICVDDLHLSASPDPTELGLNSCGMSQVLGVLVKRQRLATTVHGVVGIRDAAFVASGLPTAWNSYFSRNCIEVRLPPLRGKHFIHYIWTLLERASVHRNMADIAKEVTVFMVVLHDSFVRSPFSQWKSETSMSSVEQRPYVFLDNLRRESRQEDEIEERGHFLKGDDDGPDVDTELENANEFQDDEKDSPESHPWVMVAEPNANKDVHRLFRAFDAVRRLFLGPVPDTQLLRHVTAELYRTYSGEVDGTKKGDIMTMILDVAQRTVASVDRSLVERDDVAASVLTNTETMTVERLVGSKRTKRVSDWVVCFNKTPAIDVPPILTPFTSVAQVALTNLHGGLAAFRNRMLMTYKLNQMIASGASTSNGAGNQQDSTSIVSPCSRTMMTAWLEALVPPLVNVLGTAGSHCAFVGSQTFGVSRLAKLSAAIADLPIQICRAESPFYNFHSWRDDVRSLLRYACKKAVRVALFVPNSVLSIPGVLADIDLIVRCGSAATFFGADEYQLMLETAKKSTSSSATAEKVDPTLELDSRLRTQATFIAHFSSSTALKLAKLGFPSVASLFEPIFIGDRQDTSRATLIDLATSSLLSSYCLRIPQMGTEDAGGLIVDNGSVTKDDAYAESFVQKYSLNLASDVESCATLLFDVFKLVSEDDEGIIEEQIIEFAQCVGYLQKKRMPHVAMRLEQFSRMQGVKETIQSCIHSDTQIRRELGPEFDQLNDSIAKLERSVTSQSAAVDGHRKSFEALESSSLHMVNTIDARKQQIAQLHQAMDSKLAEARSELLKVESKHVKALAATVVPPARIRILMDAVFMILGEELPRSATTQQELWNYGRKYVCDPSFLAKFTSVNWDAPWLPSFDQLRSYMDSFDVARFGAFSPYAQAIADVITAIVAATAMREKCNELELLISDSRVEMLSLVDDLERARDVLMVTSKKLDEDRTKLSALRERRSVVYDSLQQCESRLVRLTRLASHVETFENHNSKKALEALEQQHRHLFGDIILLSARLCLLGCQTGDDLTDSLEKLKALLRERSIAFTDDIHHQAIATLQQDTLILSCHANGIPLPPSQVELLAALTKRTFFRWPLFCSSNPLFEECIACHLRDACNDCVTVSASAPNLVSVVIEAVKQGYGVIVKNFNGSEVLDRLKGIVTLLSMMIHHGLLEDWAQDPLTITACGYKALPVHPKFYLVFTAKESHGELAVEAMRSLQQWFVVLRLNEPLSLHALVQHHVFNHRLGSCVSMVNEYRTRMKDRRLHTTELNRGNYFAAKLIAERQHNVADDDATIAELGVDVGRVERAAVQVERQKQMAENILSDLTERWGPTVASVTKIMATVARIEKCLGRDLSGQSFLPDLVEGCFVPSPFILERFRTDRVTSLSERDQPLMVVLCFLERVLSLLNVGWPSPMRELLGLIVMAAAQNTPVVAASQAAAPSDGVVQRDHDDIDDDSPSISGVRRGKKVPLQSESFPFLDADVETVIALLESFPPVSQNNTRAALSDHLLQVVSRRESPGNIAKAALVLIEGSPELPRRSMSPALNAAVSLVRQLLEGDVSGANFAAAALIPKVMASVFGLVVDRHGLAHSSLAFQVTDAEPDGSLLPLFRFAASSCVPMYMETHDVVSAIDSLRSAAIFLRYEVHVAYLFDSSTKRFDVDKLLLTMATQVRLRPTKDRVGFFWILTLERCGDVQQVEVRAEMVQRICNALPLIRDLYYTSLCGNLRATDETLFNVTFVSHSKWTPRDVDAIARHRSLCCGPAISCDNPRKHLMTLLSRQYFIQNEDWTLHASHAFHYKMNCLLKGVLLFHAHQCYRALVAQWQGRTRSATDRNFICDRDLECVLRLLRSGLRGPNDSLTMTQPFSVAQKIAVLIFASRTTRDSDEERLLKTVHKFISTKSTHPSFRFMDVFESDPDIDLDEFLSMLTQMPPGTGDLCQISGDIQANEQLNSEHRLQVMRWLAPPSQHLQLLRRKSSVAAALGLQQARRGTTAIRLGQPRRGTAAVDDASPLSSGLRSRKSCFVPESPQFHRGIGKIAQRRKSRAVLKDVVDELRDQQRAINEMDMSRKAPSVDAEGRQTDELDDDDADETACWRLELAAMQSAVNASKLPPGELESRVIETLTHLLRTPPTKVHAIWLPALRFPKLFLHTFMNARRHEVVNVDRKGVYATFAFVCLPTEAHVRPGDLILSQAELPERRLRNQRDELFSEVGRRRSLSTASSPMSFTRAMWDDAIDECQSWAMLAEESLIVVLRACPRSQVPGTAISMLKPENVMTHDGEDLHDPEDDAITFNDPSVAASMADSPLVPQNSRVTAPTEAVRAERVESTRDQHTTSDLLSEHFIGGPDTIVFLSRVDVPLSCFTILPQTGRRQWQTILSLPLLVERRQGTLVRVESRRVSLIHSVILSSDPSSATSATLQPTAPASLSKLPSSQGFRRRSVTASVVQEDDATDSRRLSAQPPPKRPVSGDVTNQVTNMRTPSPVAGTSHIASRVSSAPPPPRQIQRFYWLPVGLQYSVVVE